MAGMWLHLIAAILMVAHLGVAAAAGRSHLAPLCGDLVMVLGMLDMAAGSLVLDPVAWCGVSIVTALGIAMSHRRRRIGATAGARFDDATVRTALALVLMGVVHLVAMPHHVVEDPGTHHHATPLVPFVLVGLAAQLTASVVAAARTRDTRIRASRLLTAGATMAMGAALLMP